MKTRLGFVSNSSSSSFVLLFPANYDIKKDAPHLKKKFFESSWNQRKNPDLTEEDIIQVYEKFLDKEEFDSYGEWGENTSEEYNLVYDFFSKFKIASSDSGPDNPSTISVISKEKVLKALYPDGQIT